MFLSGRIGVYCTCAFLPHNSICLEKEWRGPPQTPERFKVCRPPAVSQPTLTTMLGSGRPVLIQPGPHDEVNLLDCGQLNVSHEQHETFLPSDTVSDVFVKCNLPHPLTGCDEGTFIYQPYCAVCFISLSWLIRFPAPFALPPFITWIVVGRPALLQDDLLIDFSINVQPPPPPQQPPNTHRERSTWTCIHCLGSPVASR